MLSIRKYIIDMIVRIEVKAILNTPVAKNTISDTLHAI